MAKLHEQVLRVPAAASPVAPLPNALRLSSKRLLAGVLAGGLLALAALAVVVVVAIGKEYRAGVDAVMSEIERAATKTAVRASEVLDRVDQTLLLIKYLKERDSLPPLHAMRAGGVLADEVTHMVLVADPTGEIIDSSAYSQVQSLLGRPELALQRTGSSERALIGPVDVHPAVQTPVITVSRRLEDASSHFAGVVSALVEPAALASDDSGVLASHLTVGVLGLDGWFRHQQTQGRYDFGKRLEVSAVEARTRQVRQTRQPVAGWEPGAPAQFITHVPVARYPLVAVVAVGSETALAGYRHARNQILGWAASMAVLIVGGVVLLWLRIRELEDSRRRTQQAEANFRATLEGSMDAVTLLRAQRDPQGHLVDLKVMDCNENAAALYGSRRGQVLGQSLCRMLTSLQEDGELDRIEQVIRTREVANLEREHLEPHLKGRCLHHQVVPLDDGVALITRDVTEARESERRLAGLARLDPLTQLSNLRDFEQRLVEAQARASRTRQTLALLYVDLDGFKHINDTYGHAAGDLVLQGVAHRLRQGVRLTDNVSRLGGDEFTVLMEGAGTERDLQLACARLLGALCEPYDLGGEQLVCTPSIGVAVLQPAESAQMLRSRADAAMYAAKRTGKGRYCIDTGMASGVDTGPAASSASPAALAQGVAEQKAPAPAASLLGA